MSAKGKRRLLIAGPEVLINMLVEDLATDAGYAPASVAGTAEEALALHATHAPELAILDASFGATLADALAASGVALVLTYREREGAMYQPWVAAWPGAVGLASPFDPTELLAALARATPGTRTTLVDEHPSVAVPVARVAHSSAPVRPSPVAWRRTDQGDLPPELATVLCWWPLAPSDEYPFRYLDGREVQRLVEEGWRLWWCEDGPPRPAPPAVPARVAARWMRPGD